MKSKTKLFEFLSDFVEDRSVFTKGLDHPAVGNETYGPKSYVYFSWNQTSVTRSEGEAALLLAGFAVDRGYWPKSEISGIRVSYFKGWHWNE